MSQRIRSWFDNFEKVLLIQAKTAGLLDHNPTIGQIREFFVQNILSNFLPSGLTVGSGQVISSLNDEISKQIDIIIYDNRFPKFSITGSPMNALYPVEGVVATIEIKSKLDATRLKEALYNCASIIKLPIQINSEDMKNLIEKLMKQNNIGRKDAEQMALWKVSPKTYVYAFQGYKKDIAAFIKAIQDWAQESKLLGSYFAPGLPRVIVGEGVVGFTRDDKIIMSNENVFLAFPTNIRFGLIASHLLAHIADRMKFRHELLDLAYSTSGYNPLKLYDEEIKAGKKLGYGFSLKKIGK